MFDYLHTWNRLSYMSALRSYANGIDKKRMAVLKYNGTDLNFQERHVYIVFDIFRYENKL